MQIVIDIPDEVYGHILKAKSVPDVLGIDMVNTINAVKNGIPCSTDGTREEACGDAELVSVRQELLDRGDEMVSFRQLVERFEEVEEEYKDIPWNLRQIYNNFNILIGEEPCPDAISRQAVDTLVDELARAISDERCCISRGRSTATIIRDIYHLPSVNPQAKTGHWIDTGSGQICSRCGEIQYGHDNFRRFCASCGIRMVEPQESEETDASSN